METQRFPWVPVLVLTAGNINTVGNITIDASTFGGSMDVTTQLRSGSGAITVSVGTSGDYSAKDTVAAGNVTFDGAAATTGGNYINKVLSAGNNGNLTDGYGSGYWWNYLASAMVLGGVTIDASTFGGA